MMVCINLVIQPNLSITNLRGKFVYMKGFSAHIHKAEVEQSDDDDDSDSDNDGDGDA